MPKILIFYLIKLNFYCGNYLWEKTIQRRKLYEEIQYVDLQNTVITFDDFNPSKKKLHKQTDTIALLLCTAVPHSRDCFSGGFISLPGLQVCKL